MSLSLADLSSLSYRPPQSYSDSGDESDGTLKDETEDEIEEITGGFKEITLAFNGREVKRYGFFKCECGNSWGSPHVSCVYLGKGEDREKRFELAPDSEQQCLRCNKWVNAYKTEKKLKGMGRRFGGRHLEEKCKKCLSGKKCMSYTGPTESMVSLSSRRSSPTSSIRSGMTNMSHYSSQISVF